MTLECGDLSRFVAEPLMMNFINKAVTSYRTRGRVA